MNDLLPEYLRDRRSLQAKETESDLYVSVKYEDQTNAHYLRL